MSNTDPHGSGPGSVEVDPADAVDPDLQPGEVVGEYVIEGKIGKGGFGAVFKASHPLIGKVAAIKVLARRFSVDPEMVERFQAEARAVNQIRHRHIIDIFSFGTLPDGRVYYLMEYLEGETLGDKLTRDTYLGFEQGLGILRAIARALDAAHGKGIAHRDLKPENIFLAHASDVGEDTGEVFPKLLDFGIAKLMRAEDGLKSKTRTGIPMGTPYYMSPEQCRGRDVDHRTDYYAFGVVAYELFTGTFPLDGEDYMTILMKQMSEDAPPASTRMPGLPPGTDEVLAWLMRKDPAERPPSLAAAMQAFDAAAEAAGMVVPRAPRSAPVDIARASRPFGATATPSGLSAALSATAPQLARPASSPTLAPVEPAIDARSPPRSRRGVWIAAVVGAIAVGAGVFAVVHRGSPAAPAPAPPVASPVATPPASVTPAPPPPAEPRAPMVTLTISDAPDGTEVHGPSGNLLGVVPEIQLARGDQPVVLLFEADGFKPASRTIQPSADASLSVKLEKKPAAAIAEPRAVPRLPPPPPPLPPAGPLAPKGERQNTIEDPFGKPK